MNSVKKMFIVRIIKKDKSIVLVPFSTKSAARAYERKQMKNKENSMIILQEILQ
jgi:hypothetical protein